MIAQWWAVVTGIIDDTGRARVPIQRDTAAARARDIRISPIRRATFSATPGDAIPKVSSEARRRLERDRLSSYTRRRLVRARDFGYPAESCEFFSKLSPR